MLQPTISSGSCLDGAVRGLEDEIKLQAGGSAVGRGEQQRDVGGVRVRGEVEEKVGEGEKLTDVGGEDGGMDREMDDGWVERR